MKIQDILLPASFAVLTLWAINYFFPHRPADSKEDAIKSGQSFRALSSVQMREPKNTEIDFLDGERSGAAVQTEVPGHKSKWTFSSDGGCLDRLSFERDLGGKPGILTVITPSDTTNKEDDAFLVALDSETPYFFKEVSRSSDDMVSKVVYESESPSAFITKEYEISRSTYKMDLIITVQPLGRATTIRPRIFFPAPYLVDDSESEKIFGVVLSSQKSIEKISPEKAVDTIWAGPEIFGVEDRYFLNTLIADKDAFTQRAYYRVQDKKKMTAVLEGPAVSEKTTWRLSFYCGPKEADSLAIVDKRLDSVLDFGWFAWFAKLMLYLLNLIYSYTHNYGWAIILLTLLMRLIMFPFMPNPQKNLSKKQDMNRKMKHLEQKYRDDKEALARAKMALIKESGMFSGLGCLPLLLQFPIFIGLNYALRNSIQLYKAPFIFWIKDLSMKDPYYVLPVLIGAGFFFALSSQMKDPRQKVAMFIGSLVVGGLMANLSAGLGIFICTSSVFGVVQTWVSKLRK